MNVRTVCSNDRVSQDDVRYERRVDRLAPPLCGECGVEGMRAAIRTEYFVYFRCNACGSVISVLKPHWTASPPAHLAAYRTTARRS